MRERAEAAGGRLEAGPDRDGGFRVHLVRAGFRPVLERDERIEVVGEAADGAEAVALTRRLRPEVVLMDVRMPVLDGLEAT
jgi:YesN/AraC family two-component response regulator